MIRGVRRPARRGVRPGTPAGLPPVRHLDGLAARPDSEELDDEAADPYEWTNLAGDPRHAATKAGLAKAPPARYHPDIGHRRGGGATRQAACEEGDR